MNFERVNCEIIKLESHKELNIEICGSSQSVSVELLDGVAEIFGVELAPHNMRYFSSSFAVVTWLGCTLKLEGVISTMKIVQRNSIAYDLHRRLQECRINASKNGTSGPIVLIAGPTDVGKSTLVRSLLTDAVRTGSNPMFIDLDVGQSSSSIPGTLSIMELNSIGDIEEWGYNDKKMSVYYHGYKAPAFNMPLYFLLIEKLSKTLHCRMKLSQKVLHSGAIIDTCGWIVGDGYKAILHAAKAFNITTLIVLDNQELKYQLKQDLTKSIDIIFVEKLKGVVVRNQKVRTKRRENLIEQYFYGSKFSLKPHIFKIKYTDIKVLKFKCINKVSSHVLDYPRQYLSIETMPFGPELLDQVLAISYSNFVNESVMTTSVLGFIHVRDIDVKNQCITILSPKSEPLPNNILIMGDISFKPVSDFEKNKKRMKHKNSFDLNH